MADNERTAEKTTQFLAALTELSRESGLGIALGVTGQAPTLFVLENDECNDFSRTYRLDEEGRLLFD